LNKRVYPLTNECAAVRRSLTAFVIAGVSAVALIHSLPAALLAADQKTELTLAEFRTEFRTTPQPGESPKADKNRREQNRPESPSPNPEYADSVFLRLLALQGKEQAARQSMDRLSGWLKAAQARLQAQSAPASDVDLLRFSASKAAASVARLEAERLQASREANLLLKRPPESPLVAVPTIAAAVPGASPAGGSKDAAPSGTAAAQAVAPTVREVGADFAARKTQFEKELLPLGNDLLTKMYQSYLFGGTPLSALLWQEQQVHETELEYQALLVEAEKQAK
jgi:hypothetical protein